jgi:ubiquinone/menaquinone biosynthesis C-methylase UbiE
MAAKVPQGKVLAVDIQQEMLDLLSARAKKLGAANVQPVLGEVADPKLPTNGLDVALFVDAYHEFSHPREMMEAIVRALRPGGRVVLVEYRAEDKEVPIKPLHKMTEAQAKLEMAAVRSKIAGKDGAMKNAAIRVVRYASEIAGEQAAMATGARQQFWRAVIMQLRAIEGGSNPDRPTER